MTWIQSLAVLLGGTTLLLFVGLPVAYSFFAINILGAFLYLGGDVGLVQIARNGVVSVASFALIPIPLFILMGEVLFQSGLAAKSIDAFERIIPAIPGRLAVIAVVAGTVFSAISGSTIATTAMLGSLMVPMMLAKGYSPNLSMGSIVAIGGVDMLVPPSALAVLLGSLSGISISKLLIGGVVPGLVLSAAFVGFIVLAAALKPGMAPKEPARIGMVAADWKPMFKYVVPLSSVFFIVVGAITGGFATPTEAAALGAAATLVLAGLYGALSLKVLRDSFLGAVKISSMLLFIIVAATTFSQVLSFSGATDGLVALIASSSLTKQEVIFVMMAILILLGLFVDQVSMMLLTLPFYMSLVQKFEIDKTWFGVMFLICMQLGLMLPPHGMLLYTMKSVAPRSVTMAQVFSCALPYCAISLLMLVGVFFYPSLATWLPSVLIK
ncbi:MAG: TRAP transporter large permease subunit [Nitrospira sp.]